MIRLNFVMIMETKLLPQISNINVGPERHHSSGNGLLVDGQNRIN